MMDRPIVISEKRGITITLGVLVHFLITVSVVVLAYTSMESKISAALHLSESALAQGAKNEKEISITRETLNDLRMDLRGGLVKLDLLMQNYETDANKYIREPKDRR